MRIGKFEITRSGWSYDGDRLKNPLMILTSIIALPLLVLGLAFTAFSIFLSTWSVSEADEHVRRII